MFLSNGEMAQASADIRAYAIAMNAAVGELVDSATWTGEDAERFERDWYELVTSRLHTAANKLDGVSFEEFTGGFDG